MRPHLFFCSLVPIVCTAQAPAPVIVFDKMRHDFGRIPDHAKVSHRFMVSNQGNAPLRMKEVIPSCGCSVSVVGKHLLEPGESTFIEAQFDPRGMVGSVHKSMEVVSDDPINPCIVLTFEAGVFKEITASAAAVFFDKVQRSAPMSSSIRLESGNGQPVNVIDIEIKDAPYLSCTHQKDGNDTVLNIAINGQLIPKGRNNGVSNMAVHTDNTNVPTLQFRIQWDLRLPITSSPSRIAWVDEAGKELRANINLIHSGGKPFTILEAVSSSSLIFVSNLSDVSAAEQKIDVVLSADAKAGSLREVLKLRLDDPEQEVIEISIVAILQ
jgi:hypothetical protein